MDDKERAVRRLQEAHEAERKARGREQIRGAARIAVVREIQLALLEKGPSISAYRQEPLLDADGNDTGATKWEPWLRGIAVWQLLDKAIEPLRNNEG